MRRDEKDSYVYTLTNSLTGLVFYVGQGRKTRILHHENEARRGVQSAKCNLIREIWQQGGTVIKTKEAENLTEKDAIKLESQLILDYGLGELTNDLPGRKFASCEFRRQPGDMVRQEKPRTLLVRGLSEEVIFKLEERASLVGMKCEDWLYQQIIVLSVFEEVFEQEK